MSTQGLAPPAERPDLDRVVRRIREISTLPHVALRVLEVANDPDAGAAEMKAAMESDPALTARVLRFVNSSAIGVRERITNLQYALAYLGVKQTRNLAMTAAVSDLFKEEGGFGPYTRDGLWRHLVAVAICSRVLALQLSMSDFEDVFLAGLLHDVGIILEDQYAHPQFRHVINTTTEGRPLVEMEREHLGFDHRILGERVAVSWGFPEKAKLAIRHHHDADRHRGEHLPLVRCVAVANLICTLKGISSIGLKCVSFPRSAIEGLGLTRNDIQVLATRLDEELSSNSQLFEI